MSLQIHLVHWNYVTETLDLPISWFLSASRPWFHLHSVHIPQILLCTLRLEPWLEVLTRGPRGSAPLMTTRWRSSLRRSQYLWSVEWVPTLEASCHSLAQLEISVRTALTRTAVRWGKNTSWVPLRTLDSCGGRTFCPLASLEFSSNHFGKLLLLQFCLS